MSKRDISVIFATSLLSTLWLHNGYNLGKNQNPRIEFVQLLRNTPQYAQGIKNSGYNYLSCDVKFLDYNNKEVILHKCNYKYVLDSDKNVICQMENKDCDE